MYSELIQFTKCVLVQKSIWRDGDFRTAVAGAVGAFCWFQFDATVVPRVREHFGDLLNVTSIIFGFALAALIFYIEAAGAWAQDERIRRIADKIIDWHVWTVLCLLFLIAYTLAFWSAGAYLVRCKWLWSGLHAFLVFQLLYCGGQIVNHALTVWWCFRSRDRLNERSE